MKRQTLSKSLSVALTVALLATQSLFAYQPEKNFWTERRKESQRKILSGKAHSRIGSVQSPPLDPFPPARVSPSTVSSALQKALPQDFLKDHGPLLSALWPSHGTVRKVLFPPKKSATGTLVIHIQDVHMNAEAQKNIRDTVAGLLKSGHVDLLALEGSTEDIALQPFVDYPNRKAVTMAADYLLAENRISGPIHAALTAQGTLPRILGVDDPTHYEANVQAYKDSAPNLDETRRRIKAQIAENNQQKKIVFSPALLALDRVVSGYRDNTLSLGDYVDALVKTLSRKEKSRSGHSGMGLAGTQASSFRNVDKLTQALNTERSLDLKQVETERSRLIEKLTNSLNAQEINELMAQSVAYRTGELRYGDFYGQLRETCAKKGIRLSDYPAMDEYVRYVLLCDGIDAEKLLNEMVSLEKAAYDALAATSEEKALAAQSRQAWLTSKLVDFSLTPPEWLEYKSVNGHNMDLASFEWFYREAESRDTAMAQNLLASLKSQPRSDSHLTPIALLVTGGFHAEGMADLLTKAGATVISFVPKISKVDTAQGSAYLSVFTQEKTPLEKLFEGQKLFLANPPVKSFDVQVSVPGLVAVADRGETFGSVKEAFLALVYSKLAQQIKKIAETKSKVTTQLKVVFKEGWVYTVESTPGAPLEKDRFMMEIKKQSMNPLKLIPEQLFVLPAAMTATVIAVVTQTPFLFPVAAVAGLVVLVYFRNSFIAIHPRANADILKVPLAKYQNTIGFGFLFFGGLTIFGLIMALAGQSFLDLPTVAGIVFQHVFVYGTAYHVVFNLLSRIPAMAGLGSTSLNQDQAQVVRKALLQNYHLESIDETSFVARGAYSSVFKVTSGKGQFAAIVRNDSPDSLRFEEQIRSKASARGALVSPFVTAKGGEIAVPIGENTWLTLTPFASGTPGRWGQVGEGSLKAAMEALAKFHDSFNDSWDVEKGLIDPSRFNQIPVIQFGDLDRVVRRLDEIGSISLRGPPDPQKNTLQALLIQNTAFFKEEIGRLQSDVQEIFNLPHSVVHGDFTPPNVLFNPDGSVNNIVDFGYSDVAPRVQDLGNFMVESGGRLDWDKFIQAVLAYDRASQTPLSSEELRLLPHMLRRLYLQVLWFQAELLVEVRAHDWRNVESLFQDKLVSLKSLEDLPWDQLTSALARKRLTNMAQPFVDFLSEADQMDGRPDVFVVSGSNDLKTYVEFARTWKKLGSNIPVVVAGGRGSGTIGLIRKCLVSYGERLTADQKELLEEALGSASLTTERDILLKVVFPQEGIPDSDGDWFHEETRPSSNTEENMRNVAETVKSVLADKLNPSIALVNTPIVLLRQSLNATQIWNNEDQRNWRILRYPTYTPILAEMDDNDLFETLFRLVGSPDPSQWDSTFKGELNGVRPGARAIPDSVKIDFSYWENVIDQTLPFFKAYVQMRDVQWDPILKLLVVPNPELEKTTGRATGWIGAGVAWVGGMVVGAWKAWRGRLGEGQTVRTYAHGFVSDQGGRRAARAEDWLNAAVSMALGLWAFALMGFPVPTLDALFSPNLLAVFLWGSIFIPALWPVLFVRSHNLGKEALQNWFGITPDPSKAARLLRVYAVPVMGTMVLGAGLGFLSVPLPVVGAAAVFLLPMLALPWIARQHDRINTETPPESTFQTTVSLIVSQLSKYVPSSRRAGERAAWELVARVSRVTGAFETLMPVVQEHTGQIAGKGRSAIDPVTITLSQLKTDPEFRAGFVHAIQMAVKQQKLSGTPLNLVSSLVKAATGESIVCMHVLGNSARTELEYIEQLLLRPKESADRFKLVLVVSELQRNGEWRGWINYLENRGVSVFTVPLVAESWTRDNLVRLDRDMSSLLVNANSVVATMGAGVGISRADVEALDQKSKLRAALENAVTLGDVLQTYLRILQAVAANA